MVFNQQFDNGIRVQVENPDNLGPFLDKAASLNAIAALLDEASGDLKSGGTAFALKLGKGYTGFDNPSGFLKFNRALSARVNAYRESWEGVTSSLL